jgi:glutamyl-tRNA synthetase/glutamyl-Q tRNA(Asp) synthetase
MTRPEPLDRRRLERALPRGFATRFAPAPTGALHLGHAANAVFVWGIARAFGGRVLLRVEDHDRTRCRTEHERALREDLEWLGLEPDPDAGGGAFVRQSDRDELYAAALARLEARGGVYTCVCTRRAIQSRADAAPGAEARYPGTCRGRGLEPSASPLRRIVLPAAEIAFDDLRLGPRLQRPQEQCGDLLARDRDGCWTYQFAVAVDDLEQGIGLVVRGEDLLESTGRQIQLAALLGRQRPARFLHHPLLRKPDGAKLSKSSRDTGLADLRRAGWTAGRVLGEAAARCGLLAEPRALRAGDLADLFAG